MKGFLLHNAKFILSIAILAFVADMLVSQGLRYTPKNHLATMNRVMHDVNNYDMLFLGNSRCACGYDPAIFDSIIGCNSCNFACSGKAFRISDLRYRLYRRNNAAPKMIVVNIDQIELSEGTLGFENYQFYPYITDSLVKPILKMNEFSWLDCHIPMYRYRGDYKYIGLGLGEFFGVFHLKERGYKGYTANKMGWNGKFLEDHIKNNPEGIPTGVDSAVYVIMDKFMQDAKKENIKVVMVYSPLYHRVIENIHPNYEKVKAAYQTLSDTYDVPILDYQVQSMNYDTTYFIDANHLNETGARLFSTQLANELDSMYHD